MIGAKKKCIYVDKDSIGPEIERGDERNHPAHQATCEHEPLARHGPHHATKGCAKRMDARIQYQWREGAVIV